VDCDCYVNFFAKILLLKYERKLFKSLEAYKSQVESENFSEGSEYYMSHIRISMRFSIFVFPARPVGGSFFQKN